MLNTLVFTPPIIKFTSLIIKSSTLVLIAPYTTYNGSITAPTLIFKKTTSIGKKTYIVIPLKQ